MKYLDFSGLSLVSHSVLISEIGIQNLNKNVVVSIVS